MMDNSPVIGRYHPNRCSVQVDDRSNTIVVSLAGTGYAYTPLSQRVGFSMSAAEGLGWALGFALAPLLLSWVAPVSLTGWALYFLYNYSGNIVGHVNVEFFPKWMERRAATWLLHPIVYHALHHARYVNHYGFGSSFMDRLLGTEWEDWPELHDRVRDGRPMMNLAQRGA